MADSKVSIYILTYNNEDTIEKALKSCLWADEIVVLDHFSSDKTPEICQKYAVRFYQKEWSNFRDEYNYAISLTTNTWVMFLDSDEEVSLDLAREIREELEQNRGQWVGYLIPRMTYYLGRWIKHGGWYPDYKIRLFNKNFGRWEGKEFDPYVRVHGRVKKLKKVCYHYSFKDLTHHAAKLNTYSTLFAKSTMNKKRIGLSHLLFRPLFRFLRNYFLKRGFLDGIPGLIAAMMSAYYVFLKYAKIWEFEHQLKNFPPSLPANNGQTEKRS